MLAYRLVRLIETHSDALATGLLQRVQTSEFTRDYRKVPAEDLKTTVYEIYRHLGDWLMGKSDFDIELRYRDVGARRAEQGVPLSQLVCSSTGRFCMRPSATRMNLRGVCWRGRARPA